MPRSKEEPLDYVFVPFLFVTAAGEGRTDYLSKHVGSCSYATINDAVLCAAGLNRPEVITLLVPHLFPYGKLIKIGDILEDTVSGGHIECIRAVLPFCDKKTIASTKSLIIAATKNNAEAIDVLLPLFDSQAISEALLVAVELDRRPCIEKLEGFCDIEFIFSLVEKKKFGFKPSGLSGLSFLESLKMQREQPCRTFVKKQYQKPL